MPLCASGVSWSKRFNLFLAGANLVYRRTHPWSMPLHLQIELTNYCNLRCPICPTGSQSLNRSPQAMDLSLFERLIDEVGPYLLTTSLWAWGEPLLHPQLREILRAARKHDAVTLLSTNGQRLTNERVLEALSDEPPDYLILAIDGLENETNSMYRVGGRIEPILEGVSKLAAVKRDRGTDRPVLNMRYIVTKHNQHELDQLDDFVRQNGFELLTIRNLYTIESTTTAELRERMTPDDEIWAGCGHGQGGNTPRGKFICQEPFWFPTVFADGTVVLCEQDYNAEFALGRISENVSFADLWYSERAAQLRKTIRDEMQDVRFCRKCPYLDRPITDCNVEARFVGQQPASKPVTGGG